MTSVSRSLFPAKQAAAPQLPVWYARRPPTEAPSSLQTATTDEAALATASVVATTNLGTPSSVDEAASGAVATPEGESAAAEEEVAAADQALEELRTRISELEAALEASLASGVHACQDLLRTTEEGVFSLSLRMAERLLHREVQVDPEITRSMVEEGLRRLADETAQEVACGANLFELLHTEAFESLRKQYPFVLASNLLPYGCEVRGVARAFSVGVDVRLEALQDAVEDDQ